MIIHFNGAAQTVTGSQFLLEINGHRMLLDCGFFQGRRKDTYTNNLNFPFDVKTLDAAILSHAHIDHSGNLPNLVKQGYNKKIYTTRPTAALADIMLQDSGHIQEMDAIFVNKRRIRRGEPPIEPIYTSLDAEQVAQYFSEKSYGEKFEPIPGVTAHLFEAGHILGSASIVLDIEEKGRKYRFWFSGDIGRPNLPLIEDPVLPEAADYLMMESTYGDKPHRDPTIAYQEFRDVINRTVKRRGKIIVPAFALGRTQELVYNLNRMMSAGEIPKIPVFVDSPLAVAASQIFRKFPEYFDDETHEFMRTGRHPALSFDMLTYIESVEQSKKLNDMPEPMIIISASGMAENGRILHHLRNNIENSRNTIVIVSWQAPYTLGRRLADQERKVNIFGEEYIRRAEVVTIGGMSAHAGQDILKKYAQSSQSTLKQIFLVHGEPQKALALKTLLEQTASTPVAYPEWKEAVTI